MLLIALALGAEAPLRLPPIDECGKDRSFVQFRTELRQTIKRRDFDGLLRIIAEDFTFGRPEYSEGRDRFESLWRGKEPDDSLWSELDRALQMGCIMRDKRAVVPSMLYQLGALDSYSTALSLPGAVLRSRPNPRARIIAKLNWHALMNPEGDSSWGEWIRVRLNDGRTGYVDQRLVFGPLGNRMSFEKRDGRWVMARWVDGD